MVQALNNPDATARRNYYVGLVGNFGTPTSFFDGQDVVFGSFDVYNRYRMRIESHLALGSPLMIDGLLDLDGAAGSGTLTVDLEVAPGETIASPAEYVVRAVLYEDDVFFCCGQGGASVWDRVARDVLPDQSFILESAGESQQVVYDFAISPAWDWTKLEGVAFVQRIADGSILNAVQAVHGPTGMEVIDEPRRVTLLQNAPNPFREGTELRFTLLQPGWVRLAIFDVRGAEVVELVRGTLPEGVHDVSWQGLDTAGRAQPAGVYFYRLETAGENFTRAMTLLR